MVKHAIFLIFIMGFQFSYAQADGKFEEFFDDGQLKSEGQYKNKKKDGEWKSYHPNGQLAQVYTYTDGLRNKEYTAFFSDGKVSRETKKIDNEFITKGYYESGSLFYERIIADGFYKEYLESGGLKITANFEDGELSGDWKQFYDTGELQWIVHYKNDYRDGTYQNYYTNGQLKLEGNFRRDKKDGTEKRYLENGQLVWSGNYKANKFHKNWEQHDASGKVLEVLKFNHDKPLTSDSNILLIPTVVPKWAIEKFPVFPGCEEKYSNRDRSRCMREKISQFVGARFNTNVTLGFGLNLSQRVLVNFELSEEGRVVNVKAEGTHSVLEEEAIRVVKLLPKMQPGIQRGETVVVPYTFPIILKMPQNKPNNGRF